jgi:hypothetical protein
LSDFTNFILGLQSRYMSLLMVFYHILLENVMCFMSIFTFSCISGECPEYSESILIPLGRLVLLESLIIWGLPNFHALTLFLIVLFHLFIFFFLLVRKSVFCTNIFTNLMIMQHWSCVYFFTLQLPCSFFCCFLIFVFETVMLSLKI